MFGSLLFQRTLFPFNNKPFCFIIVTLVTSPEILTVGVGVMASLNDAVMVTVSDPDRKLSVSVSVRVTVTLELHTPHSGCLEASFLHVALALVLKA